MVEDMEDIINGAFQEIVDSNPAYSLQGDGPKRLLIMSGLPLSGKTYFVNELNKKRPDKFQLINSHNTRPVAVRHLGRKRPKYDKKESQTTFEVTHKLLIQVLQNGWPVIADATNLKEKYRAWAVDAGRKVGAEMLVIFMQVTDDVARRRLSERTSKSSATFETYEKLKYELEFTSKCSVPYLIINSEVDVIPHIDNVAKWLSGETDAVPGVKQPK